MPRMKQKRERKLWTTTDLSKLKKFVSKNIPVEVISSKMKRTPSAIRFRASKEGISFIAARKKRARAAHA